VSRITSNSISISSISSERWCSALQLKTFTIPTMERCQVTIDSVIPLSQELTHGQLLWQKKRLIMRLELQQRRRLKSLRLRDSLESNLILKSLLMKLAQTANMIPHQSLNFQRLPKGDQLNQERSSMPTVTALRTMSRNHKKNSMHSESQSSEKLAMISTTPRTVNSQVMSDMEKILNLLRLTQLAKQKLPSM